MNYFDRLEKALEYIEKNLKEKISLPDIAREACFSLYHFHRVFQAMTGIPLGEYVRRRRLTESSYELIQTDKKIIEIAFDYQFQSHEAFIRAFKRIYGISPGEYRKNRITMKLFERKKIKRETIKHFQEGITMEPKIIIKDAFMVIGIRENTTLKKNIIPKLWQKFFPRVPEIKNQSLPLKYYGICETIPDFDISKFADDTEFTEVVGIEVENLDYIPTGMVGKIMPKAEYAVFTHKGKLDTLKDTYDYIYGIWLPHSGYEFGSADDFELYDDRFIGPENPESEMDIYIPIIKV